jgi:hypothetical protein
MNDLTLLYYTANNIPDDAAARVRAHLLRVTGNKYPTVSVSQKPIDFGQNICIGEIGRSNYNCYKQILTGARVVRTEYLACCEDDTIYNTEHFTHRPRHNKTFTFNGNAWFLEKKRFWRQGDMQNMSFYICPTDLLIKILTPRYYMYPTPPTDLRHWAEPGKFDIEFGMPNAKVEVFVTKNPLITFNYRGSLSGKRKNFGIRDSRYQTYNLKPFGNATKTWHNFWND